LSIQHIKKWFKKKSIEETIKLIQFIGTNNLIELFQALGIEKSLAILEILSTENTIVLIHQIKKMKLPKIYKKTVRGIKKT
jgi:Mg/Co/Ni transporter MgtE